MKHLAFFFCLLAFGGLGKAQITCSFDVALPFSVPSGSSGTSSASTDTSSGSTDTSSPSTDISGTSTDTSSVGNINDAGALLDANQILNQGAEDASNLALDAIKARSLQFGRLLSKRADFTCTSEETCYSVDNGLFCANGRNSNFHEPDGTVGNLKTGNYTLADGRQGNLFNGPHPEQTGNSTPTASVAKSAAATATPVEISSTINNERGAPTSQATATESQPPATAAPTSNTRLATSSASSTLQTGPSSSGASTSSSGASNSGASCPQFPNTTVAVVISIIAGSLLWRTFLF